ncbi:MAG: hypothetical protein SCI25_00240 [Desulfuromonadales bacterium]|nr:hypothetical protein [Desulfuromonadales bacterium]
MTYAEIEDQCHAALEPLKAEGLKTLKSYGGEFSPDSFGLFPITFPALMYCVTGFENEVRGSLDVQDLEIEVYAAARDLRGEDEARQGAYATTELARGKLNRLPIPGAGRLVLKRERIVGYSRQLNLCVMRAVYHLRAQQPAVTN